MLIQNILENACKEECVQPSNLAAAPRPIGIVYAMNCVFKLQIILKIITIINHMNLLLFYTNKENIKVLELYHIATNEVVICELGNRPPKKTRTSKAQYSKLA